MGGCFQGQGGALRRDQLCVAGESCAGAGAISQAHVQRLIDAAVLLIAEGEPAPRGCRGLVRRHGLALA